jgi:hypothetical protein
MTQVVGSNQEKKCGRAAYRKGWRFSHICGRNLSDYTGTIMAVTVEMQNTGDPALQRDVVASIEHALADRPGDWRVSIIGSQANDGWEMKIIGPNAFERSYTLGGSSGEHRPERIRVLLGKLVPR